MRKTLTMIALSLSAAGLAAPAHAQLTGTLQKIKDSGAITVGHRESSVPFSYLDAQQKPIGYAMDLCAKVVDAVKSELKMPNLKVNYQAVTSQNRIPLMQNGTIDLECGSTTNSVARQQQVGFSVAYFITSVRMGVRKDSGIKDIGDLDGRPVVTTTGTTSDQLIKQNEKGKTIDVKNIYGKDHADSFLMVESGRAAAFVMDDILLAGLIASSKNPSAFAIVGPSLRDEPYAVMVRKDDAPFKAIVDKTLVGLMKSGEAEKLYNKWFTQPIPPRNVNLNFPMSPALKAAFENPTDKGVE
ncbi:MAG: transporter substrate-binding domain-containing protein [Aromatoleum sp.]|jgi:glutamate/aspartate transport system substrate-binding protein|uniref:transporter substrate-binding domain-containing protein n=1 Tax=Aromatoleum sp. TaxID=2307007 RepID=UPI00289610B8|nr:transporter substrate-binding domain-containing protein [Aromatoleum sp.]MDT3670518.1 transporter substrate-binding domain-containing protein [Aromatoleum sp.]